MKQQSMMDWVLLVGLLWFCPFYLVRGNGSNNNTQGANPRCVEGQKRCFVVPHNFSGFLTAPNNWTYGHACLIFLQKCTTKMFLQVENNGESYQFNVTENQVKNDLRLYILNGTHCNTTMFNMTGCVFNHSDTDSCQIKCVQTKPECKEQSYKEGSCSGRSAKYRISITKTSCTCVNCKNPVKTPEKAIHLTQNISGEGGKVDASKAADLMKGMRKMAENLNESSAALSVGEDTKGIILLQPEPEELDGKSFVNVSPNDDMNFIDLEQNLAAFSRSVTIPKEAFAKAVSLNVTTPFAAVLRFFSLSSDARKSIVLADEVVAIELGVPITNLTNPIEIGFRNVNPKTIPTCHSWNGEGKKPNWTSDGCETVVNGDNITCQCSHLTFFAVLLAPPNETISSSDLNHLTIITQVGCGLSMLFLSVALFIHFLYRRVTASQATSILIHLMVAIFLLNLTFLTNSYVAKLKNSGVCKLMGALMHYFMLATFTWFAAQAFHLCLQLYTGGTIQIRYYMLKVCITAWMLPSIIVSALLIAGKYGEQVIYTDNTEDTVTMCWITDSDVHYIVNIGYYALVFLFTFITLIIMLYWLYQFKKVNVQVNQNGKSIATILGLCCMLGITWGFAFFAHGVLRIAAYYIFTILNSFHGFFLFIYYYNTSRSGEINAGVSNLNSTSSTSTLKTSLKSEENPYNNMSHQMINKK
uniref:Probable G-protein coupled receptor 97 n=1 Tax=Stegastes partitus TaxID=144197 RepID=A0A3B5BGE7_9TELE